MDRETDRGERKMRRQLVTVAALSATALLVTASTTAFTTRQAAAPAPAAASPPTAVTAQPSLAAAAAPAPSASPTAGAPDTPVTASVTSPSAARPLRAPVVSTVTTYAAPGNSGCAGPGACATITWQPVKDATDYSYVLSVVNADGSLAVVQQGRATSATVSLTGLTADARYDFKVAAEPGGAFTLEYPVWPELCALPQPYGPANFVAARTAIWDGQSWIDWVHANTPGEFVTTLQWTFDCESDSASELLAAEYINGEDFTRPVLAGTPVWHLAAP